MPGAGYLDQRLTLQQRAPGQDALGDDTGAWQTVSTVWGHAKPLRGREFFAAGQMQAAMDVQFTIRWRADVAATWRVLWRGVPHDVVSPPIDVDGRREYLELMCASGVRGQA